MLIVVYTSGKAGKFLRCAAWLLATLLGLSVLVVGVAAFYDAAVPDPPEFPAGGFPVQPVSTLSPPLTLKVVTFNLQNTWVVGKHRPERMRAIGKELTALDPDLVAFQEALVDADRAILLRALAGSRLRYNHYFTSRRLGSGLLVCSAFPIRATGFRRFTDSGEWYKPWEGDWWVGKGIALTQVALPGGVPLDFYNTHTQAGYGNPRYHEVRANQLRELATYLARTHHPACPALFVGDLNCRPQHAEYQALVRDAGLDRLLTIPSGVDEIFAVRSASYSISTLESRRIEARLRADDGQWTDLSDHPGFLSVIRLVPNKDFQHAP